MSDRDLVVRGGNEHPSGAEAVLARTGAGVQVLASDLVGSYLASEPLVSHMSMTVNLNQTNMIYRDMSSNSIARSRNPCWN